MNLIAVYKKFCVITIISLNSFNIKTVYMSSIHKTYFIKKIFSLVPEEPMSILH